MGGFLIWDSFLTMALASVIYKNRPNEIYPLPMIKKPKHSSWAHRTTVGRSQKISFLENRKNYWWWLFHNCPLKWPIWRCQQKKIVNVQPEQANQLHPTQPQDFILCYNSSSEVFVPIITLWVDWYQPSQLTNFGTLASLQQVCKLTKPKSGPNIKDPTQN